VLIYLRFLRPAFSYLLKLGFSADNNQVIVATSVVNGNRILCPNVNFSCILIWIHSLFFIDSCSFDYSALNSGRVPAYSHYQVQGGVQHGLVLCSQLSFSNV
jgi:hypothetical protein